MAFIRVQEGSVVRPKREPALGPRAQAVLDVVYRLGEVSGPDIMKEVPGIPSYSAVRSILRALARKGLVKHRAVGLRYVYRPTVPKGAASRRALSRLIDTYFGGTPEPAMQALLDLSRDRDRDVNFDLLERMIEDARKAGR
jgi:predicted transcriptional regulator